MKSRIALAVAAALAMSMGGGIAFAQGAQQQPPPQQQPQPQQPQTMPPASQGTGMGQSGQAMSNGNGSMSNGMQQKIKRALTTHGVTATHVHVMFQSGTATLSGTVFSQQDIAKAKKAAMDVHGVKHVDTSGLHAKSHHQASAS